MRKAAASLTLSLAVFALPTRHGDALTTFIVSHNPGK